MVSKKTKINNSIRVIVLLLAAGRGTRLRPLSYLFPKVLFPMSFKTKILDYSLKSAEELTNYFMTKIIISVAYKSNYIKNYIKTGNENIQLIDTLLDSGSGFALYESRSILEKYKPNYVFILPCDQIHEFSLIDILNSHMSNNYSMTIICKKSNKVRHDYATKNKSNVILRKYSYKPIVSSACTGNYLFTFDCLMKHIYKLNNPKYLDLGNDIVRPILNQNKIGIYDYKSYWEDLGTWGRYLATLFYKRKLYENMYY